MKVKNINFILLIILGISIIISFLPYIFLKKELVIYPLLLLLCVINISRFTRNLLKFKNIWICILLMINFMLVLSIFFNNIYLIDIRSIFLTVCMFFIFLSVNISNKQKEILIYLLSLITLISSYTVILFYYKGNLLSAISNIGVYFWHSKNSFSPILLFSIIFFLYRFLFCNKKIDLLFFFLGFLSLLIIQSRTNILCIIITVLVFISIRILKISNINKRIVYISLLIITTIPLINEFLLPFIDIAFRLEHITYVGQSNFLNNLTSGRLISYSFVLDEFLDNPFLGTAFNNVYIFNDPSSSFGIHNIWLRALLYGGIIYYTLFLMMVYYFYKYFKTYIKGNILLIVMVISAVILSNGEPYAPFGPGTTYSTYWMMIAFEITMKYKKTIYPKKLKLRE